jgi:hypothetical protein
MTILKKIIPALMLVSALHACSSNDSTAPFGPDQKGPDAGVDAAAKGCATSDDCIVPPTAPPGCATAKCDAATSQCRYLAADADGDSYGTACQSLDPKVTVEVTGGATDCDDKDAKAFPGAFTSCGEDSSGKSLGVPTDGSGTPVGICAFGQKSCQPDGKFGKCVGAVGPDTRVCSSKDDNDCDGKPDKTECGCVVGDSRACDPYPFAPAIPNETKCTDGTSCSAPCQNGSQSCAVVTGSPSETTWGPCIGAVGPRTKDACEPGDDGNCNGVANEGCLCVTGDTGTCGEKMGALGNCAAGTAICTAGVWACGTTPNANDSCELGDDATCNGVENEGCPCLNGTTGKCGAKMGVKGNCANGTAVCSSGQWSCNVTPKTADSCDPGDDATCNGTANEGCACVNGQTGTCGAKMAAKGNCAAGNAICSSGKWSCGTAPLGGDTCELGDDATCNGKPNEGCTCVRGASSPTNTQACGPCNAGTAGCNGGNPPSAYGACNVPGSVCTPGNVASCTTCSSASAFSGGNETCTGACGPGTCTPIAGQTWTAGAGDGSFSHGCGTLWGGTGWNVHRQVCNPDCGDAVYCNPINGGPGITLPNGHYHANIRANGGGDGATGVNLEIFAGAPNGYTNRLCVVSGVLASCSGGLCPITDIGCDFTVTDTCGTGVYSRVSWSISGGYNYYINFHSVSFTFQGP